MKKNVFAMAIAACMAASLAACGGAGTAETTGAQTTAAQTTAAQTTAAEAGETASAEETTPAETKAEAEAAGGVLVMATNAEFAPWEYYEGDKIVGIDPEIAQAIADKLGMTLEIEDMAFDSIIPAVTSGKADFGAAGMTVDEDRMVFVDFTDTYANASQVIIVKETSEIAGSADLSDKKIGVQLGTTGDLLATDLAGDDNVERYNKGFEAVQALLQDKIDAVVIDSAPANVFVEQSQGLKVCDEAMSQEEYAIAVAKGNTELLDKINGALKELKEDGTIDAIMNKYIPAE
ncbi:MAG: basic amino acid ABC transporter substrate-binding protein [Lachnospiraceae bacterium]|jgi:polar amino acid transport system substrate-binding protein|nr:basic amino acid ABC transporter substrate-binding protein [Lachnospiraceae bacterium]